MGKHIRMPKATVIAVAMATLAVGMGTAWAQAPEPKTSEYDYVLAADGLGLGVENQLQNIGKFMAWATPDSIRFARSEWGCTLDIPGHCSAFRRSLPGIALPKHNNATPPPFTLSSLFPKAVATDSMDVVVAVAIPGGKFHRYELRLPSTNESVKWTVHAHDSAVIPYQPGQRPLMIAIKSTLWDNISTTYTIAGTARLYESIGWWQGKLTAPGPYPFPAQEDWMCSGSGYYGATGGYIYAEADDTPPIRAPSGMPTSVLRIDGNAALGADGWVSLRKEYTMTWTAYHLTPGDFYGFRIVKDRGGVGIWRHRRSGPAVFDWLIDPTTGIGAGRERPRMALAGNTGANAVDATGRVVDRGVRRLSFVGRGP